MFRPPFGIFWDSGLWTWLTGDSLSKPMYRLGHWLYGQRVSVEPSGPAVERNDATIRFTLLGRFQSALLLLPSVR